MEEIIFRVKSFLTEDSVVEELGEGYSGEMKQNWGEGGMMMGSDSETVVTKEISRSRFMAAAE